ncbi:MAG: hypothetical protein B6U76_01490 [Desulfurococcales archaeon ex4484_217_2]|nr:MAG: hypothetical protein B6U76_01490 [Desulfurococcales archaeon ex4484_217_2]
MVEVRISLEDLSRTRICPRCGRKFSYLEKHRRGDRIYVYAVHYEGYSKSGRRISKRITKCYLGPVEEYEYVSALQPITLYGLLKKGRLYSYVRELTSFVMKAPLSKELAIQIAEQFEEAAEVLRKRFSPKKSFPRNT